MPITRTPWIDDDGTGTTGTIINNAEKTLLYNQIDAVVDSPRVPINPAGLTFNGGWVVTPAQLPLCEYVRHGIEAHVRIQVVGATVNAGASANLDMFGLPFVSIGPTQSFPVLTSLAAGGWGVCQGQVLPNTNVLTLHRMDFDAWPASSGLAYFYIDIMFPASF